MLIYMRRKDAYEGLKDICIPFVVMIAILFVIMRVQEKSETADTDKDSTNASLEDTSTRGDCSDGVHEYQDYVCTVCQSVDKAHAYEYLAEWIVKNGTADGQYYYVDSWGAGYEHVVLVYDSSNEDVFIGYTAPPEGDYDDLTVDDLYGLVFSLRDYTYSVDWLNTSMSGAINAQEFTSTSSIIYSRYEGDESIRNALLSTTRNELLVCLDWVDDMLAINNLGITLYDLGFESFRLEE